MSRQATTSSTRDVLLDAVEAGAARAEQHRRDARPAEDLRRRSRRTCPTNAADRPAAVHAGAELLRQFGARRDLEGGAAEGAARVAFELGVAPRERGEQALDLPQRPVRRLARECVRRSICRQAVIGIDARLASARGCVEACSEAGPSSGCRSPACRLRSSSSSSPIRRPIRKIASRPSAGRLPCAATPRVSMSTNAKPLCATPICRSVGSVTTAASRPPVAHERLGAEAGQFLVGDAGHDEAAAFEAAAAASAARGVDHGRDAALHVLAAAPVQAPVADRPA